MKNLDIGILIVDDEASVRDSLYKWFKFDGYRISTAADASAALQELQNNTYDIVLLDIKMPGMDGLELQKRIKQINKNIITIMITAFASVDTSIQALKEGAFDYIVKPIDPDNMSHLIRNAVEQRRLAHENIQLRQHIETIFLGDEIIGESPIMKKIMENMITVAQTDSTVMIKGESGTGKELIARAIHSSSNRRYFPIITINCGAYREGIIESELFGHEKEAFAGALYSRRGKLEMADKGTIFLDEIGNIGEKMQKDLLRLINTKQFSRLGSEKQINVDFRIICSTGKDLENAVQEGAFSEDLYYRLNVFNISLPPLRERRIDIPSIARFFIKKYAQSLNKNVRDISQEALQVLVEYEWPGNVRELRNVIERAMVITKGDLIELNDLFFFYPSSSTASEEKSLEDVEKVHIEKILGVTGGNIAQAASILKISRLTLYNKIEKYNLRK